MKEFDKEIVDYSLDRTIDKYNAFLKLKGLEEEFARFRLPESPVISILRSHESGKDNIW